jgi:tetratricopeptide (TPR) repeat protein
MKNEHYNPYDFINPIKDPKLFAGRKEELKEIDYYLELSRSKTPKYIHLALIGDRASGKTSLLNIIKSMADEKGLLAVKIPLNKETSSNDIIFFKEVFDGIMTVGAEKGMYEGISGKIYRAFRKMIDTLDVSVEIPIHFGTAYIGLKRRGHEVGIPQHVLIHDLREFLTEAKKNGMPTIVLLFDECNLLAQNETLLQKIRNAFMELDGYILAFSGTEKMFPAISNVFSPIPRFFKRVNIENFKSLRETEECLIKPLDEGERKALNKACIREIHQITGGSPYEINLVAHYMYRRWEEKKNPRLELSTEVLEEVLREIERLRKEGHHEVANKVKRYWADQLRVLISLLEFPNVSKEWLAEYMLLDEVNTLQLKDVHVKKSVTIDYVEALKKDSVIAEKDGKITFKGDKFDILYLKYLCTSKGIKEAKDFALGLTDDPLINLHDKFAKGLLLEGFQEYYIHTGFDKREKIEGKTGQKFIVGVKVNLPPGETSVMLISPETQKEFYLGAPNSVRFRVNVQWMKDGFITQIKFKRDEDKKKLQDRLEGLRDKLDFLGYKILLKDEISWNVEGAEFSKQGKLLDAMKCFDEAIKINPLFELPYLNKAGVFFNLREYDKALEAADKALELRASWSEALTLKGRILIHLKENQKALECLEKAVNLNLENWGAWDNKGRALFNLGNYEQTVDCFNKVIKAQPDNLEVLKLRAISLWRLGNFDGAIKAADKISEIDSQNIEVLILKGLALGEIGKYREASQCCDKILEIEPKHPLALYNKACFESRSENVEDAIDYLKRAIEIDNRFIELAKEEEDFNGIRNDKRFMKLIG